MFKVGFGLVTGGALITGVLPVIAQDVPFELEEIVVTAQKRAQSQQDVPIAVSAFSGAELEGAGVGDLGDLVVVDPSLLIRTSTDESRGASLRIRGVGTTGQNSGLEGSVGVFVDGVYLSRSGIAMNDLVDIERVEVLRGPQGTLFGKNTSSGALAIATKKPDFEFGGHLQAAYGNYDSLVLRGSVTGALVEDKLAGRLAFSRNKRNGTVDDASTDETYNDKNRWVVRGQLLWTPNDDVEVRFIGDYGQKDENCCASPYSLYGPAQAAIAALGGSTVSGGAFAREVAVNVPFVNDTEEYGFSGELSWDWDGVALTALSSYRRYEYFVSLDGDRADVDLINTTVDSAIETITQEVRFQGRAGVLDWLVGGYYFSEDIADAGGTLYGNQLGDYFGLLVPASVQDLVRTSYVEGGGAVSDAFEQDTKGWSVFTHNNIQLSDEFTITAGLRYNSEDKEGAGTFVSNSTILCTIPALASVAVLCPVSDYTADTDYQAVTGTLKVSYAPSDDVMVYGGYSRGFKAGGINLNRNAAGSVIEFDPEKVNTWELGIKSELLNRKVRLNGSVYYSDFTDYQLNTFDGVRFVISNAAGVKSKGFEVDLKALLTSELILTAGYAYNDSKYTNDTIDANLAGRRISLAPESTVTGGMNYVRPLGNSGLKVFASANVRYQTGVNTGSNLAPEKYQSSYALVNAKLGVEGGDGKWEIALWGNNIFDQDYFTVIIDAPGQSGSFNGYLGNPATYGLSGQLRF